MRTSSDDDVAASLPVLEPLLLLAASESLTWTSTSSRDGFVVEEVPAVPELQASVKCFRTHFTVEARVDALASATVSAEVARACDPTLKEMRTLSAERGRMLLYTSYTSPSPWLVSPRDFCVVSASVIVTPAQLQRLCPQVSPTVLPEYLRATSQDCDSSASVSQRAFLIQNSQSTTTPLCPSNADGAAQFVRGVVHCFGYLAWPDAKVRGRLHVTNYCCVDAGGRIPKWLVAAAVDQNTQKLRRLKEAVEKMDREELEEEVKGREGEEVPHGVQSEGVAETQCVPHSSGSTNGAAPLPDVETAPSCDRSRPESTADRLSTLPVEVPPLEAAAGGQEEEEEAISDAVQTPGTMMSALSDTIATPSARSSVATPTRGAVPPLPPQPGTSLASLPPIREECSTAASTPVRADSSSPSRTRARSAARLLSERTALLSAMEPVAALARAHGWHTCREVGEVEYAELRCPPPLLRAGDGLTVGLRVSTTLACSLASVESVLCDAGAAPELDPELVRLVTASPSPSPSTSTRREPSVCEEAAVSESGQLRHYQFNAVAPFRHAWDAVLRCAAGELSPFEGGQLGLHALGVPASTFVWAGRSDPGVESSRFLSTTHQRIKVTVCGVVAVAIPRTASTVRVSHYFLFDAAQPSLHTDRYGAESKFAVRRQQPFTTQFLAAVHVWMGQRMGRLRSLCEAHELRRQQEAMVPLDKEPLLRFLYDVHVRQQQQQRASETESVSKVGDVLVRRCTLTADAPPTALSDTREEKERCSSLDTAKASSPQPPLYVSSLIFPCSLDHLSAYMRASSTRSRYRLDADVVQYEELAAPSGFEALSVAVRALHSPAAPPTSFTFLETFGQLHGNGVPEATLVLSRVNCDGPQRIGGSGSPAYDDADDSVQPGVLYCSGWVASALTSEDSLSSAPSPSPAESRYGRKQPSSLLSRFRRGGAPSPLSGRSCTVTPVAAQEGAGTILVTQYSCTSLGSGLSRSGAAHDDVSEEEAERQAQRLLLFRDAVCAWKAS